MARILVFGDSIAFGAWDREGGWVQRLRKVIDEKNLSGTNYYSLIYNIGVSGNTTENLLERFEFEAKQRLKESEETIIIFSIGINDSAFIHAKKSLLTQQKKFEENIQKLINLAKKYSQKIFFVGLTAVDEPKVSPWKEGRSYKNKYIQKYNDIIKSTCKENNVSFVDIFQEWIKTDYKSLLEDGLHPNSEGHKRIFDTVRNFLIRNKII